MSEGVVPFHLPDRPMLIMGILNVTPDSFSDGGRFLDPQAAIDHGLAMIRDGADIIDVGAESTRPGSSPVDARTQIDRAIPVIRELHRQRPDCLISIDTRSSAVAAVAIEEGASLVNDISAGRNDPAIFRVAAGCGAGLVLMHMQGEPATMQVAPSYDDVVADVASFLRSRAQAAIDAGVNAERIILDPGIGFGKTSNHNLALLRRLEEIVAIGPPVLVGASRKRFLGQISGQDDPSQRLGASLACVARSMSAGAGIVRVHDVRETRQLVDTLTAIAGHTQSST